MKQFLSSPAGQWFVALLVAPYLWLLRLTCKRTVINGGGIEQLYSEGKPVLVALWHGRLLMMPILFPKGRKVHALISAHKDGRIISHVATLNGINTVTGSSSQGGAKALREMVRYSSKGDTLFITPDGPKGPRMRLSAGTIETARLSGATILPVSISCSNGKLFKSWDRFMLPKPFSTITIVWGKPVAVPAKASKEERATLQQSIENTMNQLTQTADENSPFSVTPAIAETETQK